MWHYTCFRVIFDRLLANAQWCSLCAARYCRLAAHKKHCRCTIYLWSRQCLQARQHRFRMAQTRKRDVILVYRNGLNGLGWARSSDEGVAPKVLLNLGSNRARSLAQRLFTRPKEISVAFAAPNGPHSCILPCSDIVPAILTHHPNATTATRILLHLQHNSDALTCMQKDPTPAIPRYY